jgi:hypothetical protein
MSDAIVQPDPGNAMAAAEAVPADELARALSTLSISTSTALVAAAAVLVGFTGRYVAAGVIGLAAVALPIWVRRWQDDPRDRREALLLGTVAGLAGLMLVGAVGRSGIPLLLVPAALCSGFDFGHWRFSDEPDALRDLKQRTSRLEGSIVALCPAYVGGAVLIATGKGTGTAVLALLAAPWLYSSPAVTIFLRSWRPLATAQTTQTRRTVAFTVRRHLHRRVVAAGRHLSGALATATDLKVDPVLIERLQTAVRRCEQAQDRAFLLRRFDHDFGGE